MKLKLFLFLLSILGVHVYSVQCLTDEELAAFKPVDPDHVDINTGLKSEIWGKDNGDDSQTIYSNAIPSHETWQFPRNRNPNYVRQQNITMHIYKEPIMRDEPLRCLPMGYMAVATSGTPIFTWWPAVEGCPDVHQFEELDICEGHPSPENMYHYHYYSPCVQMPTCGKASTIWGVAVDGIPIYGPFDEDGIQLTKQDLDECGGKYDSKGRYKYHMTIDPPYSLGCIMGEIRSDLGEEEHNFFCSCPYDDRTFKGHDSETKLPPPETLNCDFTAKDSTPAICKDNIDSTYDIGYTWNWLDTTIDLAPCCPEGQDCGSSCKTESGTKDACYVEKRTVKFWTRVKETQAEETDNEEEFTAEKTEDSYCLARCIDDCENHDMVKKRSLDITRIDQLWQSEKEVKQCKDKCGILCSIETTANLIVMGA